MKILFLGTGSAFTVEDNYHSNLLLINDNDECILIDCGSDARHSLHEQGYSFKDINDVFISHVHADHAGGLEWLAFSRYFHPQCEIPNLYLSEQTVDLLWNNTLKGGLSSLQNQIASLDTYFKVHSIADNETFMWQQVEFHLIQTLHYMQGYCMAPTHGLFFEVDGVKVYFTSDTQFAPHMLMDFYQSADIIFHDCQTTPKIGGVHAHYKELKTLPKSIREKMWLYHYNPGKLPDANKDGFKGFVKKGQIINL